jgi:hypothetical protein
MFFLTPRACDLSGLWHPDNGAHVAFIGGDGAHPSDLAAIVDVKRARALPGQARAITAVMMITGITAIIRLRRLIPVLPVRWLRLTVWGLRNGGFTHV